MLYSGMNWIWSEWMNESTKNETHREITADAAAAVALAAVAATATQLLRQIQYTCYIWTKLERKRVCAQASRKNYSNEMRSGASVP